MMRNMRKNKTLISLIIFQIVFFLIFFGMTIINEILDLPYYLLNDKPTSFEHRIGEIYIEFFIFFMIILCETVILKKFYKRIKTLEGFIPICANCKKIRKEGKWEQIEKYISENSLVDFTHSICPECAKKLYPDLSL